MKNLRINAKGILNEAVTIKPNCNESKCTNSAYYSAFQPLSYNYKCLFDEDNPINAVRLGISSDETDGWTALFAKWEPLYLKCSDKKNSRTTSIKDQLLAIIKECVELDKTRHFLDRIASSINVTIKDMETFNIKKGVLQKSSPSVATAPILTQVIAALRQ